MPEPGIADHYFNRPTTDREKPQRGRLGGKRLRKPIKLPREYADFQLENGRRAIEVLGESFFEPDTGIPAFEGNPRFSQGPAKARRTPDRGGVASARQTSGDRVEAGAVVGSMQDRAGISPGMENHFHLKVVQNGAPVDPSPWLERWRREVQREDKWYGD